MPLLQITLGTDRRRIDLPDQRITFGRSPDNDVVLDRESTVSRVHAALDPAPEGWVLHDLGSRNGTWLGTWRIDRPTQVGSGDEIGIGGYVITLREHVEPSQTVDAATIRGSLAELRRASAEPTTATAAPGLTAREVEVIRLVATGRSDQAIADELFISIKTVHSHLDRIRGKIGLRRRPDLTRFAVEQGLV